MGWTPESEDGTDTLASSTTLSALRTKYQQMKAQGSLPKDTSTASSGLEAKANRASKGVAAATAAAGQLKASASTVAAAMKHPARV